MGKLRRVLDLFNRCADACEEDRNEARVVFYDVFEPLMTLLGEFVFYLRRYSSGKFPLRPIPGLLSTNKFPN